jgi:hypothetical protein
MLSRFPHVERHFRVKGCPGITGRVLAPSTEVALSRAFNLLWEHNENCIDNVPFLLPTDQERLRGLSSLVSCREAPSMGMCMGLSTVLSSIQCKNGCSFSLPTPYLAIRAWETMELLFFSDKRKLHFKDTRNQIRKKKNKICVCLCETQF